MHRDFVDVSIRGPWPSATLLYFRRPTSNPQRPCSEVQLAAGPHARNSPARPSHSPSAPTHDDWRGRRTPATMTARTGRSVRVRAGRGTRAPPPSSHYRFAIERCPVIGPSTQPKTTLKRHDDPAKVRTAYSVDQLPSPTLSACLPAHLRPQLHLSTSPPPKYTREPLPHVPAPSAALSSSTYRHARMRRAHCNIYDASRVSSHVMKCCRTL